MLSSAQVSIRIDGGGGTPLGKRQQQFNKLVRQVEQAKSLISAWKQAEPDIRRDIAELSNVREQYVAVLAETARVLDRAHDDKILTKSERRILRELLLELVCDALELGAPDELKAIYNRHTRGDFDAEAAAAEASNAELARTLYAELLGIDVGDDFQRAVDEQVREEAEQVAREQEARRARRKRSAAQVAAEARKEAERVHAGKAIQDIYRKLARALHPDHEADAGERVRKTELMQEVNVAYEAKDLLTLLELQLRCEQLDPSDISALADERLMHLNRVLVEQLAGLRDELASIELPYRLDLDWGPRRKLMPAHVRACVSEDLHAAATELARARRDTDAFRDPRCVKVWLSSFVAPRAPRGRARR